MKIEINGKEYKVPQTFIERAERYKQEYPDLYPTGALDEVLMFNYDGVITADDAIKFRYDNNLESDYEVSIIGIAVVNHVYGIGKLTE